MESSCLNMAHFYSRKADNHLRYRRYDEAIASHQKAVDLLEEAITKTTVPKSIESLQLQRDHHMKHKDLVLMKKDHFDKYTRALEQQKRKNAEAMEQLAKDRIENSCQLQLAIYKTMEDTDSLLEVLCNKGGVSGGGGGGGGGGPTEGNSGKQATVDAGGTGAAMYDSKATGNKLDETIKSGLKIPKDDSMVIEELRTLNHQLHILVFQLVSQLDEVNQESEVLREKMKLLERSKGVQSVLPLRQVHVGHYGGADVVHQQPIKILTESLESEVDLKVIGGGDQIIMADGCNVVAVAAADDGGIRHSSPISEELPPLELPTFDFTTFECKK